MNNYLTNIARRASGEVLAAVEPPARLTFLPDDGRSAEPAEPSYRYPPAFEASTIGRGAMGEEDEGSRASDRRWQAPGRRFAPPPSRSDPAKSAAMTDTEGPRALPEGTRIVKAPSENPGPIRSTDHSDQSGIGRVEALASAPDRTNEAEPSRPSSARKTSRYPADWSSAGRGGGKPSLAPVVESPGSLDRTRGLSSAGETSPSGDTRRAAKSPVSGPEASGVDPGAAPESESTDGGTGTGDHPLTVEPRDKTGRFDTATRTEPGRESGRSSITRPGDEARRAKEAGPDLAVRAAPPDRSFERGGSRERSDATPSVEVHIGTIELRGSQTGPSTQDSSSPDRTSGGPKGFGDYAAQRRYEI